MTTAHSSIAGIDPGKTGALAILHGDNSCGILRRAPVKLRGKDVPAYAEWSSIGLGAVARGCG
jgi:hypothetical protein